MNTNPLPSQDTLREWFDYRPDGSLLWRTSFRHRIAGKIAGCMHPQGYRRITFQEKTYGAHRLVYQWHHGNCPEMLDHINRNKSDNRIENLRPCTMSQNAANAPVRTSTGVKNIHITPNNTYQVAIRKDDVTHRKMFKTLEEAIPYANQLRNQLHGQFANP